MSMLRTKVITLVFAITSLCACSSQPPLEISQSDPNYHGDETDNGELQDLTKEGYSEEIQGDDKQIDSDSDSGPTPEPGDFKGIYTSDFNNCAKQGKYFNFLKGECAGTKTMHTCSYASIISGDYSRELEEDDFNELVSEQSLIQCFDYNGEKMVQVAEIRNDGSGNLDIDISCWIDEAGPCNI